MSTTREDGKPYLPVHYDVKHVYPPENADASEQFRKLGCRIGEVCADGLWKQAEAYEPNLRQLDLSVPLTLRLGDVLVNIREPSTVKKDYGSEKPFFFDCEPGAAAVAAHFNGLARKAAWAAANVINDKFTLMLGRQIDLHVRSVVKMIVAGRLEHSLTVECQFGEPYGGSSDEESSNHEVFGA